MSRQAKHDIAPMIRNSFFKGLKKYCRKHGKTFSDAFSDMIEEQGLGYTLDKISKFTVTENKVSGQITHEHTLDNVFKEIAQARAVTDGTDHPALEVKPRLVRERSTKR